MTEEEARKKVHERQSVNKLEDYIKREKGDIQKGLIKFNNRQERWLNSLNRSNMKKGFSWCSKLLFDAVKEHVDSILYGKNEHVVVTEVGILKVDCFNPKNNKIIEFFGDYWHGNPEIYSATDKIAISYMAESIWEEDKKRIESLKNAGYSVMVVWEKEYKSGPQDTVNKCIEFLK